MRIYGSEIWYYDPVEDETIRKRALLTDAEKHLQTAAASTIPSAVTVTVSFHKNSSKKIVLNMVSMSFFVCAESRE